MFFQCRSHQLCTGATRLPHLLAGCISLDNPDHAQVLQYCVEICAEAREDSLSRVRIEIVLPSSGVGAHPLWSACRLDR
jgi:hypothetical protein